MVLIVGYESTAQDVFVVVNDPFPYPLHRNPYLAADGKQTRSFRYKLPLKNFTERLFWHWSIYNISLA